MEENDSKLTVGSVTFDQPPTSTPLKLSQLDQGYNIKQRYIHKMMAISSSAYVDKASLALMIDHAINQEAKEGWEVAGMNEYFIIFKRPYDALRDKPCTPPIR